MKSIKQFVEQLGFKSMQAAQVGVIVVLAILLFRYLECKKFIEH
jgi:hypothetical protein